jgi:hypothetical protein
MRYECIGDKIFAWLAKPRKDAKGNEITKHSFKKDWLGGECNGTQTNWYAWFAWYSVKVEGKCVIGEVVWRQDRDWHTAGETGIYHYKETEYRYYENTPTEEESTDE